ncbi:crossover junction endonuclease MUS81 isoform X3 [Mustela putorius furo]|uniref:Crossover junction endonuclease MUS81 n=1 Tax=Mustela putorius furo TaxID=9669 RepID=A0A8U0REA5_MUSPF|nr:crossover junction endonuclease MUS81 isoform X3 [Mustela putorius furo]
MAAPVRLGRKRPLPVCPNPLFVRWLTEWRDEAASRGRRTQFVFQKALRSLRRYPLPLRSGKEAKILQHFGDRLCHMLDQRLQQHEASGGDHAPTSSGDKSPAREGPFATVQDASMPLPAQPKAGGSGSYWPARHSGAREILLLLYREHLNPSGHGFLAKEELLQGCTQKAPRVAPGSTRPWPALRSLLHRNLVLRTHRPARYSLTAEGLELARKLAESEGLSSLDSPIRPEEPPGEEPEVPGTASAELGASEGSVQQPPLELEPGEYRVLLCVDTGEAKGAGHRPQLLLELQRLRVPYMVRKLHVGDFVWVAQETRPRDPARPGELVLDHIVERKRLDDLCSSIIDGRFLPVKALWPGPPSVPGRGVWLGGPPQPSREHAAAGCHQHSGHRWLLCEAHSRPQGIGCLPGPVDPGPPETVPGAIKNKAQSVREVFARQLMQVRGVSGEKAAAIVDKYSTPASLLAAYDACATPKEQEMLLSTIKCGQLQRNLGPALSRTLSQLYCCYGPLT